MKLVNDVFEKLIINSPIMLKFAVLLERLAREVHNLGTNVANLTQAIEHQQQLMNLLYTRQGAIMKALENKSLDLRMPETKQEKVSKPN